MHANHHYSSSTALKAVIQAEFSLHQQPGRSSSSSVDLSPITDNKDQYVWQPRSASVSSDLSPNVEMREHPGRQLKLSSSSSSEQAHAPANKDVAHHERDSSSASSVYSPRNNNTLPLQKKVQPHSDPRYTILHNMGPIAVYCDSYLTRFIYEIFLLQKELLNK